MEFGNWTSERIAPDLPKGCGTNGDKHTETQRGLLALCGRAYDPRLGLVDSTGAEGTIYERQKKNGSGGPSSVDLGIATTAWLKEHKPEALDSKV